MVFLNKTRLIFRGLVRPELDQPYGLQRANLKAKVLDTRNEVSTLKSILTDFCFSVLFITRYVKTRFQKNEPRGVCFKTNIGSLRLCKC